MHPKIRSLCLTIALALLSLTGLSTLNSILFESSIALGQAAGTASRKEEAESIFRVSQKTSAREEQNAKTLFDEGMKLYQQQTDESLKAAIPKFEEAARLYAATDDRRMQAKSFVWVGLIYDDLGEKQKALEYYNQSLPLRRAVGDRGGEATTLSNIGGIYNGLGENQKALEYYNRMSLK